MSEKKNRTPKRVRNELRFRQVTVAAKTLVAENFWRIDFTGDELAGFVSPGFDDHIKVFFPDAVTGELPLPEVTSDGVVWPEGSRPISRDYTPLWFDGEKNSLTLDFYIHDGGVASQWADRAQVGDPLAIGGPRGSMIVPDDYHFQLYVCDESGLPAFKRRKETAVGTVRKLFAFADEGSGSSYLEDLNGIEVYWLGSGNMHGERLQALLDELDTVQLPVDDYFIWLTGEGEAVKQLSDYFVTRRGCDDDFVRAVAYWHQK